MDVPVIVEGQRMILHDGSYRFAPQSQRFVKFIFDLSGDWKDMTIFAQWIQGEKSYNALLDYEDCVYMPSELTKGQCVMMLYGAGNDGKIATTMPVKLNISNDLFVANEDSTEITQSLYDQLVADVSTYVPFERLATLEEVSTALGL